MATQAAETNSEPRQLRDRLTIERLNAAVADLRDVDVVAYFDRWWDGQCYDPCLVVRHGSAGERSRVIETGGECVVLPFNRRAAARELAQRRAPRRVELGVIAPRTALDDIVLDAAADAIRCASDGCGAMRPIDAAGPCPLCGKPVN